MEFCRACGAELLVVTPVCSVCGQDNTRFVARSTAPSFKPAVVPPGASAGSARAEIATEVTPLKAPAEDLSGLQAYPCVEAPAVTMSGGANAMPGAPQTLEQLAESLLAVEDPAHRPPVLQSPVVDGVGVVVEGASPGRPGAEGSDGSRRSSTQPGGPMPSGIEAVLGGDDVERVEEHARAAVGDLVDDFFYEDLADEASEPDERHEVAPRGDVEEASGLLAMVDVAEGGVALDAHSKRVMGEVDGVSPPNLDDDLDGEQVAEPQTAPSVESAHAQGAEPASPEAVSGASPGVVKPASAGGGARVAVFVGAMVMLLALFGLGLGGLYVFSPGLFNGEAQRDDGVGEVASKPQKERAESRRGGDEGRSRTKSRTARKDRAARQRGKEGRARSKTKRAQEGRGEGGEREPVKGAREKGKEARGESGKGVDERSVLSALKLSEVVRLRSFRAERFTGFVHGADFNNRLHDDTWSVVQLAGVDVLVIPMLPGVDPVATGRLVANSLREAVLNHREGGGRVGVFKLGEAFQLVWQSAGEHDAIPLISLELEALKAIGRFDADGEVTPRQRAEALARWCGWMLDTVVLKQVPEAVKDESLRRALKEMTHVSGPAHAETLPRSVRARLNQSAYVVAR